MRRGEANLFCAVRVLVGVTTAVILLVFGWYAYPLPSLDAFAFVPATISHAAGAGLENPLSKFLPPPNPLHPSQYVQYPPLYNLLVSWFMWEPQPQAAFTVIAAINVGNVLLTMLLLGRAARGSEGRAARSTAVLSVAALAGLSSLFVVLQNGRPEVLATFWVLLGTVTALEARLSMSWLPLGAILGLLAGTHPAAALVCACLLGAYYAGQLSFRAATWQLMKAASAAAVVLLVVLLLSPNAVVDTVVGTLRHARLVAGVQGFSWRLLLMFWVTNPHLPLHGLAVLAALSCGAALLASRHRGERQRLPFLGFLAAGLAAMVFLAFRAPQFCYNLFPFLPLMICLVVFTHGSVILSVRRPLSLALTGSLFAVMLTCSIGALRHVTLFPEFARSGVSLDRARATLRPLVRLVPEGGIEITTGLWVLTEDYDRLHVFDASNLSESLKPDAAAILYQQGQIGRLTPPEIPGYRLWMSQFRPEPVYLAGIRIANTVPGYQYAAYVRSDILAQ